MSEKMPPMEQSDEATKEQLEMAREQGRAAGKALNHMLNEVADDGGEKTAGDYLVSYAIEEAEGMYYLRDGELQWHEPDGENVHIEVGVRDASDGRLIPGLNVRVRLFDSDGHEVGHHRQPFLWHPWLFHYGRNWQVPGDGEYRMEIHIEAATFPRHDKKNGRRFAEDVQVEFSSVRIETGQD